MNNIKHVFFDLDHTLWDYEKNSTEALIELHSHFGLNEFVTVNEFLKTYHKINEKFWHQFNSGQIDREYIIKYRFPQVLRKLKIFIEHEPSKLHEFFLSNCSNRSEVFPYCHETLTYLKEKYPLAIITNGFPEAQYPKMKASNLEHYFDEVIISVEVGFRKPDKEIFDLSLAKMNAKAETSVMIGDNPKTDIRGAKDAGIQTIFFNPNGNKKSVSEYEIDSLKELIDIL